MTANAPPPIWSSPARSRARCAAWLRPARSPFPECAPVRLAVIGAVALHLRRPLARASALAPDGRDALDQSQQLCDVVAVRPRQARRERDAAPFDQQVMLTAQLAAIYRAFPGLLAPVTGPHAGTVNDRSLPRESPLGTQFREDVLPQLAPDAARVPFEESAAAGMTRRKSLVAGRFFHGTPVLRAKMMPVSTWRASAGLRPACWTLHRFFGFGSSGSMRCHSWSERIESDIQLTPVSEAILYLILFRL